ncbi:MAG: T9SS type A sorting domain-containing protein [Bacteroidales bacterium]|nr:T9SS type A sorting domain-containing protein [Bacteroidales bacterium]
MIIQILPNPFCYEFSLNLEVNKESPVEIIIIDSNGKLVYKKSIGQLPPGKYSYRINTQSWASGLYFCRISISQKTYVTSLIIKQCN